MSLPRIATQEEWTAARRALLDKEKDLTRQRDLLNTEPFKDRWPSGVKPTPGEKVGPATFVWCDLNDDAQAQAAFDAALKLDPTREARINAAWANALANRGHNLISNGKSGDAEDLFRRAIERVTARDETDGQG